MRYDGRKKCHQRIDYNSNSNATSYSRPKRPPRPRLKWPEFFYFNHVFYSVVFFFLFMCVHEKVWINALTVSKCFYEGDFTVFCNKSRLPTVSSNSKSGGHLLGGGNDAQNNPLQRPQSGGSSGSGGGTTRLDHPVELIHYARVINGLQHNNDSTSSSSSSNSQCSYVPGASACARKRTLAECLDKPSCHVKNNWFSLEPECPGNSYYTQFEYDCQPAFVMCDEGKNLASNVFSALVYSPNYPRTFRTERSEQCYLTLYFPSEHHVEISLEFFDLLPTSQCIGDYLEIRQYIHVKNNDKKRSRRLAFNDFFSNSSSSSTTSNSTGAFIKGKNGVKTNRASQPQSQSRSSKSERQQRDQSLKWEQLGVMCGIVDSTYTIQATSNIINFKFRPLPSNHQFFTRNTITRENLGFKIFVQAIPPVPPTPPTSMPRPTKTHRPPSGQITGQPGEHTPKNHQRDSTKSQSTISISIWLLVLIAIVTIVILFVILGIILLVFFKKRQVKNNSNSYSKTTSTSSNSKAGGASSVAPTGGKGLGAGKTIEVTPATPSTSAGRNLAPPPSSSPSKTAGGSKVKYVMEPEPRKMQAERPLLLQDLSQSRLLLKFKQENKIEPQQASEPSPPPTTTTNVPPSTSAAAAAVVATVAETAVATVISPAAAAEIKSSSSVKSTPPMSENNKDSPVPNKSSASASRKSSFQAKMVLMTKTIVPSMSGVYGEDSYDGGGVYGADFGNGSPPAPIVITKIERRPSKDVTNDKTISETTKESKKSKSSKESTPKEPSTAKSSRKQSKDTLMAADLEKAYLISAVNECHGNIEETTTATTVKTPDSISSAQSTTKQQQQQHKTTKFSPNEVDIDEEKQLIKATSVEDQQQQQQVESQEPTTSTANHRSPHHHHHHHHQPTTPRKPAFNPLHVILKDKNKYHTTEYI